MKGRLEDPEQRGSLPFGSRARQGGRTLRGGVCRTSELERTPAPVSRQQQDLSGRYLHPHLGSSWPLASEAGRGEEAPPGNLGWRSNLHNQNRAAKETLTCQALGPVSANVHRSDGRKMAAAQAHRLAAEETPPLSLRHVVMPLKTTIKKKRATTTSHDADLPIQQREAPKSLSRGQGGLCIGHCHMIKASKRGKRFHTT